VAEHTHIPWTGYTYCPWWGCSKVAGAPECEHCYAADGASRHLHLHHIAAAAHGEWTGRFTRASEAYRRLPETKWKNPDFVFWSSMSDVFHEGVDLEWVEDGFQMVDATLHLTWLILTKRPGNCDARAAPPRSAMAG
jgi:protein gp37